ncbi:CHAT domain protein [Ceratobasidium sp. AG-Ba]|nr:CHAT domain protein [Ceratobasidium sp. AG-Ba]
MLPKPNPHAQSDDTLISSDGLGPTVTDLELTHQSKIANKTSNNEVDSVCERGEKYNANDDSVVQPVQSGAVLMPLQTRDRAQNNSRSSDSSTSDQRQPLELSDNVESSVVIRLAKRAALLYDRATQSKNRQDIDEAIRILTRVLEMNLKDEALCRATLNILVVALQNRFDWFKSQEDQETSIKCMIETVRLAPENYPKKPDLLISIGGLWLSRFERLGELADLDHAIDCQSQAVALTPDGHPDKPGRLNNLGISWLSRFEQLGELADLDHAMDCQSQAVALTPDGHPDKPACLNNLGNSWSRRFERLGEIADLDHAMDCQSQAVALTPDGHPDKPGRLNNLGNSWLSRFERLGEIADLDHAIDCQSQAVALTPDCHPNKPTCLNNLGLSWFRRFERLGEIADLDHAMDFLSQAVTLTPDGHPDKPGRLNNLGNPWSRRFERLGEIADLDHAIDCQSQAVALTPDGHPDKPGYLNNLGLSWSRRFERLGELADLDHAIDCESQAVALTPDGHPDKPGYLNNLGNSWSRRFERLGEIADLDYAMDCQSQAVALTPDGHPDNPGNLNNLGISWLSRFERLGELADLDHAIDCQSQAVALTPDGHPDKPGRLNNLGNSWSRRFERLGELADLDHAIGCQSQAVALTPDGHPDKPACLNNLGNSWSRRFERLGEIADLDHAIDCQSQAVALTPDGHPDKPGRLNNLGNSWLSRFERLGELAALEKACSAFKCGATITTFNPSVQMKCAQRWAAVCMLLKLSPLEAYHAAFSLLPRLVWIGQTTRYRHANLVTVRDLAAQAAAWAISANLYDLALEWLEQGRSVIWGQTLRLRTSINDLHSVNSELALRFHSIAFHLDAAASRSVVQSRDSGFLTDLVSEAAKHHQLADEWDEILGEVQQLPGFENFLKPSKSNDLKLAAHHGPVIMINTHLLRCDALILFPGREDILHVPLTTVRLDIMNQSIARVHRTIGQRGDADTVRGFTAGKTQDALLPVLMWSDIVEPVLKVLGYTVRIYLSILVRVLNVIQGNTNCDELPHVTWCTTGAMSLLPLHAAGMHDGKTLNACDLVVSSYTPTLTALLWHKNPPSSQVGLLAVAQQASPGQAALPNTVEELKAIRKYSTLTTYHELEGASATVDATLAAMRENSWVHLACHAVQDLSDPSQSAFHLHDGPLMLEEIARRQFKNKGLAFLSACETATGDRELPDEATHLAAGMLIAGYPSVIGTMWSIKDEDAPLVADIVYSELLRDGKMDHTRSARALHKAVKVLREKVGDKQIWRWAPFIHIGV